MKHIVYTRHSDGGVDICTPTQEVLDDLRDGRYWADESPLFWVEQIRRQIKSGIAPEHAYRFAYHIQHGGCDEAEALDIIKDRDCARHGYGHTIVETEDLPADRWFRDAWRQASNSGQIYTDLEAARSVQWLRLIAAVDEENKRRKKSFRLWRKPEFEIDEDACYEAIAHAPDVDQLKAIWPQELPRC